MKKKNETPMVTFSNVKKKKQKEKPLKTKAVSKKKASIMAWFLIIILPLLVLTGTIRMFGVLGQVEEMQEGLSIIQAENRGANRNSDNFDITLITHTMNEFVSLFINVNLIDQESTNERIEALSEFISFDARQIDERSDRDLSRVLTYYDLLSMRDYNTHFVASYRVEYQIERVVNDVEETNDDDLDELENSEELENEGENYYQRNYYEENESYVVLNVPFVIVDGLITVVSMPYFTSEQTTLNNNIIFDMLIENDPSEEMRESRESISTFLPTFFEMYARSDEAELALFMEQPVLMGGRFNLDEVDVASANFVRVGQGVMVQVSATFYDQKTNFFHTVPFTLVLEEQANSWFVLEMHHLFVN